MKAKNLICLLVILSISLLLFCNVAFAESEVNIETTK